MLERIVSNTSEYSVLREESGQEQRKGEEKLLKSTILCVTISSLVLVLVYGLVFISIFLVKSLAESSCPKEDPECLSLICPVGMSWDNTSEKCHPPSGYRCCVDKVNIFSCFRDVIKDKEDERCRKDILASGLAPSPQAMCYPGFVWVPRKNKCVQTIG